jgi:hypothetical protein
MWSKSLSATTFTVATSNNAHIPTRQRELSRADLKTNLNTATRPQIKTRLVELIVTLANSAPMVNPGTVPSMDAGRIFFFLIGPAKDGLGRRCFHWIGDCGFFGTGGNGENGEVSDGGRLKVEGWVGN